MTNGRMRYGDFFSGLFFFILSIYVLMTAIPWGLYGDAGPGPGFFPVIYGVLMLVLGFALLGRSVVYREVDPSDAIDPDGRNAALMTWLALALSIPLMLLLGFLGGFGILTLFLTKIVFKKSIAVSLLTAVALSLGLYAVFHLGLEIDLPASMFLED